MLFRSLAILFCLLLSTYSWGSSDLKYDGYIVKFKSKEAMQNALDYNFQSDKSNTKIRTIKEFNMAVVEKLPQTFSKTSDIEYIEPNYIYHTMAIKDPKYSQQWGMSKIKAEQAWKIEQGSQDIVVAVIDTGVDYSHEDLQSNMWVNYAEKNGKKGVDDDNNGFVDDVYGYDFANSDDDPMDDHNHGTHCAGVIGATHNDVGVRGVNAHVKIMALKFLTGDGSGSLENALKSIKYAVDNGAKVLSNSWGGGGFSQALYDGIKYAQEKGVIFVAAAGNESTDQLSYPASYDLSNIVSVAASDSSDNRAYFSNYGTPHVDIAAPGVNVLSTIVGNSYGSMSGTSMATPHVAGAFALLLSHEDLSYKDAIDRILWTSDYLPSWTDVVVTSGRLNVYNALMDTRPSRPMPPPEDKWVSIDKDIESVHPYEDNKTYTFEVEVPYGAEYVRFYVDKIDTEAKYDKLVIKAGNKEIKLDGNQENFYTKHLNVSGSEKIILQLTSDYSVSKWGFKISKLEWQ